MINIAAIEVMNVEKMIEEKRAELATLKGEQSMKTKKNQKSGTPAAGRKYVLLDRSMKMFGKVPQQQQDLAAILSNSMEVGREYTEAEVFNALVSNSASYSSIASSVQDPTYLFKYYRGLKNDGRHAGFIARNFIRQIG